jgi:hypothetical protein
MIAEVMAGWQSLKAAKDIVQGLNGMQTAAAINDVKLTLQGHILDAQQSLFAAQEAQSLATNRIGQLEAEISRLKDWSSERERYELVEIRAGAYAFMQKAGMRTTEPAHWLCANCFGNGKKSILQVQQSLAGRDRTHACPACKATITVNWSHQPTYSNAE